MSKPKYDLNNPHPDLEKNLSKAREDLIHADVLSKAAIKHTPGPWILKQDDDWFGIESIGLRYIDTGLPHSENEANARLIAVAPELLEMLISLHNACVLSSGSDIEVLRLIEKATGESK